VPLPGGTHLEVDQELGEVASDGLAGTGSRGCDINRRFLRDGHECLSVPPLVHQLHPSDSSDDAVNEELPVVVAHPAMAFVSQPDSDRSGARLCLGDPKQPVALLADQELRYAELVNINR
jgi:hypothetical protein